MKAFNRNILLAVTLALPVVGMGQGTQGSFAGRLQGVSPSSEMANLSLVDSTLLYTNAQSETLQVAQGSWSSFGELGHLVQNATYVVRHPVSGHFFFTRQNGKNSELYELIPGNKPKVKKIQMGKSKLSIEHPVFSGDGAFMVFSSTAPNSRTDKDLFFSVLRGNRWSEPFSMGKKVNTPRDEITPSIYGDFLIFSSNGRNPDRFDFDLYATRLISLHQNSDTVMMYPIGISEVQSMGSNFNTESDEMEFVSSAQGEVQYWVRGGSQKEILCHQGAFNKVALKGVISDEAGNPVVSVQVNASGNDFGISVQSNEKGEYDMLLPEGVQFTVVAFKENFFSTTFHVVSERASDDNLFYEITHNVELSAFDLGNSYTYHDIFAEGASLDFSDQGEQVMVRIVEFAVSNPSLKLEVECGCALTENEEFNTVLNDYRAEAVKKYLLQNGVAESRLTVKTLRGCPEQEKQITEVRFSAE